MPIVERLDAKISNKRLNDLTVGNFQNKGINIFKTKGLSIDTEFINMEMIISIEYKTKSKVNADKLVNMLRDHHVVKGAGYIHNLWYYYIMPDEILDLMDDIVETRKINFDDGKTIADFIKDGNYLGVVTLRSDINGLEGDLGLAVVNKSRVQGMFESETKEITAVYDYDLKEWSVPIEYKVNYLSPESFLCDFEIVCNNSLLDTDKYLIEKMDGPDTRREEDGLYPIGSRTIPYEYDYVVIPPIDNHPPFAFKSKSLFPIMSVLTTIELNDLRSLFNLKDLYYYVLDNDILEYIKRTKEHVVVRTKTYYKSMFRLDLYKDNKIMSRNILAINDDLDVYTTEDLDITGTYRCVLSIITNLNMIDSSYRSLIDIVDKNKIDTIFTGIKETDFRVSDNNLPYEVYPVGGWSMKTAQTSIVRTFFKKGEV